MTASGGNQTAITAQTGQPGSEELQRADADTYPQRQRGTLTRALSRLGDLWPVATSVLIIVVAWYVVVTVFNTPTYIVPPPTDVFRYMTENFGSLLSESLFTVQMTVFGFLLACCIAIPLAVGSLYVPYFDRTLYPIIITTQIVPKVALMPLFVIWFGYESESKIMMTFLISFFPILMNTLLGLRSADSAFLDVLRSMRANKAQELLKVRFPSALPAMFVGLKMGMAFAVVGAIVGEFIGSDKGLGHLIILAQSNLNTTALFGVLVWLTVVGLLLYFVIQGIEHVVLRRFNLSVAQ